jgi:hypothetical protein
LGWADAVETEGKQGVGGAIAVPPLFAAALMLAVLGAGLVYGWASPARMSSQRCHDARASGFPCH